MDITVVVVRGRTHGLVRILTPRSMITNKAYYSSTFSDTAYVPRALNGFWSCNSDKRVTSDANIYGVYRIHVLLSTIRHFGKTDSQHQHGPSDMTSRASDLMPGKRQMKPFHPLIWTYYVVGQLYRSLYQYDLLWTSIAEPIRPN